MLTIYHNSSYTKEKLYIFRVIFEEWLGINYHTVETNISDICIMSDKDSKIKKISICEVLFSTHLDLWLTLEALPQQPLKQIYFKNSSIIEPSLVHSEVPVIYGKSNQKENCLEIDENQTLRLGIDIFGSIFFMITRYEEYVKNEMDNHGRFPAHASLAYQEGFLTRPIVNEYLEILWSCLQLLDPLLNRKKRQYSLFLTHDVDHPLALIQKSFFRISKNLLADLGMRHDMQLFGKRLMSSFQSCWGDYRNDPNNTFDFLMRVSEQFNIKSHFFFIAGHSAIEFDGHYSLDMPWIRKLMRSIHEREHKIGLHPSYHTYCSPTLLKQEFSKLLQVCEKENISQDEWGGRHHYLRWKASETWQHWNDVGLNFDSTLSFADHEGFRCGVCYDYPVFNLLLSKELSLREVPLIVMDGTILGSNYRNLGTEKALENIIHLTGLVKKYDGTFTLLWHNNFLLGEKLEKLYKRVIVSIV